MTTLPALLPPGNSGSLRGQGNRALWSAVVQQAADDIAGEPMNSTEYTDGVAFFTHGGLWGQSRAEIADRIGVHADDLKCFGRRIIAARRLAEGLPPELPRPQPPAAPPPLPSLVAVFVEPPPPRPRGHRQVRRACNPFDPFRALPSGMRRTGTG